MSKFKVGDKVKVVVDNHSRFKKNDILTISKVLPRGHNFYEVEDDNSFGIFEYQAELVEEPDCFSIEWMTLSPETTYLDDRGMIQFRDTKQENKKGCVCETRVVINFGCNCEYGKEELKLEREKRKISV